MAFATKALWVEDLESQPQITRTINHARTIGATAIYAYSTNGKLPDAIKTFSAEGVCLPMGTYDAEKKSRWKGQFAEYENFVATASCGPSGHEWTVLMTTVLLSQYSETLLQLPR
jgi:hypothetical protein